MRKKGENYVYILTNKRKTVLYIGVTSDIQNRMIQHKNKAFPRSFTARYNVDILVYLERYETIGECYVREHQLKAGSRADKIKLIQDLNPSWQDLTAEI